MTATYLGGRGPQAGVHGRAVPGPGLGDHRGPEPSATSAVSSREPLSTTITRKPGGTAEQVDQRRAPRSGRGAPGRSRRLRSGLSR